MLTTRPMTARRTEQFLKELRFTLEEVQDGIIVAYAKNGEQVLLSNVVAIYLHYRKDAKLPSDGYYVIEIYTQYDDYESI